MQLIDLFGLLEADHHKAYLAHPISLYVELHVVLLKADVLEFLMKCDVDLAPLPLVELHVDALQVQVHLILEVS